jgi:hypothetical protein
VPEEVRFVSGDGECAGTLYWPAAASLGRTPCVVMANGVSMTRRYSISHFTAFLDGFDAVASDQAEFLTRHFVQPAARCSARTPRLRWRPV